jgi:hypothetical protein
LSGGINNPVNAIEQMSYLIFLKRLEDTDNDAARRATHCGTLQAANTSKGKGYSKSIQHQSG